MTSPFQESGPVSVLDPLSPSGAIPVTSRGVDDFAGLDSAFGPGTSAGDSALDSGSGLGGFDPFAGLQAWSHLFHKTDALEHTKRTRTTKTTKLRTTGSGDSGSN